MKRIYNLEKVIFTMIFSCIGLTVFSQTGMVQGTVSDADGPLINATVLVEGTTIGAVTDFDGNYSLSLAPGDYSIMASYLGYSSQSNDVTIVEGESVTLAFLLSEGQSFDEIVVTGTRAPNRTNTNSAVPIDVINVGKLTTTAPQTDLNQLLHNTTPSFNSNTQTISDGTDHIDPASLRGLGPDQVLVLLNNKRRHNTSLVNVNGTFGRGNVGTDLNAIPASAVQVIEVLRDGAAAQYGSDAIAGVINIKLNESVNELNLNLTTGANFTSEIGPFGGEEKSLDGEVFNLGANYGLPLGKDGGFINMTGEMNYRGSTNRMLEFSGDIFNALNAVERVAVSNGIDISQLTMEQAQNAAQSVNHFSSDFKNDIANAADMDELSGLLSTDVTEAELDARNMSRSDFNMRVGQSEVRGGKFFGNMKVPVGEHAELYGFGGIGYRRGESGCFYRLPTQNRTTTSIYLNGTVPLINSDIVDKSFSTGIRGDVGGWNVDLSNTYGTNSFLYYITNTHNATLGASSPTEFNAGGHSFTQNTANLDISQYMEMNGIEGVNVAFGAEYRVENYKVIPGTEESYGNYDVNGNLVGPTTSDELLTKDFLGRNRPSGAQCFAGFLPFNEVDVNRTSNAGYLDLEFDITPEFLLGAAVRFEDYSDFGSTFNYKLAGRYLLGQQVTLRGAYSTGFRAPSLHQIHFSRTSTIFSLVDGVSVPQEVGLFANTSRAAKLLGIPQLKEETSENVSLGVSLKVPEMGLKLTVDAYMVNIDDRIVLTGQFDPGTDAELQSIFQQAGATRAAFFANAIDTESQGIDVVVSHFVDLGGDKILRNTLAATFSKTERVGEIHASDLLQEKGLVETYFDQTSRIYLERAVPRSKVTLGHTLDIGQLSLYLRNTYFGETIEATNEDIFDDELNVRSDATINPVYSGKIITDFSVGYSFSDQFRMTVGANNLLDVYPDEADPAFQSNGLFVYSRRSPQFSFNGRHLFARLSLTLK